MRVWVVVVAGGAAMCVTNGIGRFVYTPLLPWMAEASGLGVDVFGAIASANFAGYLIGAILATRVPPAAQVRWLIACTLACAALTGAMALVTEELVGRAALPWAWGLLRLALGIASAVAFVSASALTGAAVTAAGRPGLTGVAFAGVGIGIALSGLLVALVGPLPDPLWGGWRGGWIAAGLVCLALCVPLAAFRRPAGGRPASAGAAVPQPTPFPFPFALLCLAYFCEGTGYSVTATFLVQIIKEDAAGLLGEAAWIAFGIAAAPSAVIGTMLAQRFGMPRVLILGFILQGGSVVLAALLDSVWVHAASGLVVGAALAGVTSIILMFGRAIRPGDAGRALALLTAWFGLGQIVGPLVAGIAAERLGSFTLPLAGAGVVVLGGGLAIASGLWGRRRA